MRRVISHDSAKIAVGSAAATITSSAIHFFIKP
jgi:hypothetical protein